MYSNSEIEGNDKEPALEFIFHPRSIAIAGVSTDPQGMGIGNSFVKRLRESGYKGNIYPLNPSGGETLGMKIFSNVKDVPEPVDFVISAVPARNTPQLIKDCVAKGVKLVHLFTAGFSELGNETGKRLESEIIAIARKGGIRLTGPNGMGLYCPQTGLNYDEGFSTKTGPVGWIAQSGRNCTYVVRAATLRGVNFSKAISYGNGLDLNESDFIEYFRDDPETEIIAAYIEGVKDGRRFLKVLKEAARVKPVIIMKAGITDAGSRATESHTASIAGSEVVWEAALKQAGAIQVSSLEEMVDLLVLFRFISRPKENNISILGFGGGAGVQATDSCVKAGINVPLFPEELQEKLKKLCGREVGSFFKNPFDLFPRAGVNGLKSIIELIAGWDMTDLFLIHLHFDMNPADKTRMIKPYLDTLTEMTEDLSHKTMVIFDFIITAESKRISLELQSAFAEAGYSVFSSSREAATALGYFIKYHKRQELNIV
ncbi:acetate--CoA ligase family protein [Chloroflexota bacterium]